MALMTPARRSPRPADDPPAGRAPGRRVTARRGRERVVPYLFVLAPIALLVTFTYVPVANMFAYSVTDWDGLDRVKNFVGLANYVDVFTEPDNLRVFVVSLYYLGASFVQMALALYFATVLSFRVRLKNLWKGILFFPYLINGVAIGLIFLNFIRPGGGLDSALLAVGLESVIRQWTGDPEVINYTLAAVSVWRYMGLNFVMFLGAIASVPGEIYEAAELDGANRWHQFRHLILPSIKPIVGLSFILAISGSLSVFEVPYIMTNGGNGSETFVIRTIKMAFENNKVGLASAMAVVLLAIVLVVTCVQRRLVPEEKVDLT
ncbi:carbohydrate ABC transporter permease [Pseudactinotalea suaedae]|uniref:carbohydrate ABC transporter permease n=1 Tax=Pseudactinotalea suaedae TaxID=1524924 RepID=UPI0012E213AC|nr:sugar ABC transporter permease [Pseudactinotalea suaedae]